MSTVETTVAIDLDKLQPGQYQPRHEFNPEALQELADSIQQQGLIEPIIVRPLKQPHRYEIIAGERRWRSHQLIGKKSITCIIRYYDDEEAQLISVVENVSRTDLNPIEEALAYQRLLIEFDYTHEKIARKIGKSRSKITNLLRLLGLPYEIRDMIIAKKISEGHAKILLSLGEGEALKWANMIVDKDWSVRQLEKTLKSTQNKQKDNDKDADIRLLEKNLSEYFGSAVELDDSSGRGELRIHYADIDVLQGILDKIPSEKNNTI